MCRCPGLSVVLVLGGLLALLPSLWAAAPPALPSPKEPGKKISLDIRQAEIGDVLRLLGEVGGLNMVISPEVSGTVTVRLVQVPWEQALDAITRHHGLAQERSGSIIMIAPRQRLLAQRQERLQAGQAEQQAEPLVTRVVPVKYRSAVELKATLEAHLGRCASVSVDTRTNTLILTGTPSCLQLQTIPTP